MSRFQPKFFTPELRAQAAAAVVTLREAVTTARQDGAGHIVLVQRWEDEKDAHRATGRPFGETDPWYHEIVRREKGIGESEARLEAEERGLREACTSLEPLIGQLTLAARRQIGEEVKALLSPYYSGHALDGAADSTELASNVSILFMRLRMVTARDFVGLLRHGELVLRVLEDLLADKEVFRLQPAEALAA